MAAIDALPRAAILYLFRKHLTRDAQTIIIQPQYYRKYQKWAEFICNKVIRTKLFDGYVVVERCILNDYLKSEPIVCSVLRDHIFSIDTTRLSIIVFSLIQNSVLDKSSFSIHIFCNS